MKTIVFTFALLVWIGGCAPAPSSTQVTVSPDETNLAPVRGPQRRHDPSDVFFDEGQIPELRIEIAAAELQKLRENNRTYVRCTLHENDDVTYKNVGVKLKGAAGSFREIDDRPALTLNMDKFSKKKKQFFHDLDKFHLNNSVQDESYLNELLCAELFLDEGIATPRVTHARVWLNGRDVGLYVLKEGFDTKFLKQHFHNSGGNLYDGGFVQDIDVDLEKDSGDVGDAHADLHALRAACAEPDPARRWQLIEERLNVDNFLSFVALELMTCHWDGYAWNKNNYRIYFNPTDNHRAYFLPHGMDQMFGDPGASVLDHPGTIVAAAVMQNPEWRTKYRERLRDLVRRFSPPDNLLARVDEAHQRLRPVIAAMSVEQAQAHDDRVRELKERLTARAANLTEQVEHSDPSPQEFDENNVAHLADWYGASECEDAMHEEVEIPDTPPRLAYSIRCGPSGRCIASWRRKVLLAKGRYEFAADVKTADVAPLEDDRGTGAGLRISGAHRVDKLTETTDWTPLRFEFTVLEDVREVELVAELKATQGQAWFDRNALRLLRLPPPAD